MSEIDDLISKEALANWDKFVGSLDKAVAGLDKVIKDAVELDKILSKAGMSVKDFNAANDTLNKTTDQSKKVNDDLKKNIDLITQAKENLAKADAKLQAKQQAKFDKAEVDSLTRKRVELERLKKAYADAGAASAQKMLPQIQKMTKEVIASEKSMGVYVREVGHYENAMKGLGGTIGQVNPQLASATTAVKSFGKAFLANPITAVITVLAGAFALLFKAFKSTDEGATKLAGIWKGLKNVVDVLIDRVMAFFKVIKDVITFNWKDLKKDGQEAFGGLGDAIRDAWQEGKKFADEMDRIGDAMSAQLIPMARMRKEVEELRNKAKDRTKSEKERLAFAQRAYDLEVKLSKEEVKWKAASTEAELGNLAAKMDNEKLTREQKIETVKQWLSLDAEQLESSRSTNSELAKFYNNNEEEFQAVQKSMSEVIDKEAEFYTNTRRLASELSGFQKEIIDDSIKVSEEAKKAMTEKKKELGQNIAIVYTIDKIIDRTNKEKEKRAELNKELGLTLQPFRELTDAEKVQHDAMIAAWEEEKAVLEEKKQMQIDLALSVADAVQTVWDRQLDQLEAQKEAELKIAGDNADQKAIIEEKYAKKKAEIQRKAAITEKIGAMFSIAIDTAKGVANAMSKVATIPLVPWIIAQGAIQMAVVAAKPIPKYAKGTRSSTGGLAVVGEQGQELIVSPSGQMRLSGDGAELTALERKSTIYNAGETAAILRAASGMKQKGNDNIAERRHKELIKAIQEKDTIILKTGVGNSIEKRQGVRYKTYFNRHIN
ncbi:MAG: hypothetical protein ABFD04_00280 [Syntrophomonas sp.]